VKSADVDGDGQGDPYHPLWAHEQPDGHVDVDGDCDDTNAQVFGGAPELCDGVRNDCARTWSASEEEGRATFASSDGGWFDVTEEVAAGTWEPGQDGELPYGGGDYIERGNDVYFVSVI